MNLKNIEVTAPLCMGFVDTVTLTLFEFHSMCTYTGIAQLKKVFTSVFESLQSSDEESQDSEGATPRIPKQPNGMVSSNLSSMHTKLDNSWEASGSITDPAQSYRPFIHTHPHTSSPTRLNHIGHSFTHTHIPHHRPGSII